MSFETISSTQNTRIKDLVRLHEGKHRRRQKRFIIEGYRELERALEAKKSIDALYFCDRYFRTGEEFELLDKMAQSNIPVFSVSESCFKKISFRDSPDGILASAPMWDTKLDELLLQKPALLVIAEKVEKPGNLGTLLRTADGAGADAVIIADPVTDLFSPNIIRTSQGAIFSKQSAVSDNETLMEWLRKNGIQCVATTPHTENYHWNIDYKKPTAILVGTEATGLSDFWLNDPDCIKAKIPMQGNADSLNVAAATSIFLYEAVRQRMS